VDKMREVDPSIICIASGEVGQWSEGLFKGSADHMNFMAEHFYSGEKPDLAAHVEQIPHLIREKAQWHRDARKTIPGLADKNIRIAMTEWNYWYGPHEFGELGTRYFVKDALGIAVGLHEYARQSDIIASAFYAQTVNVIGAIKTSRRNAAFETTGLVLKLYRNGFGTIPATTQTEAPLNAQAAWSADRRKLTIGVVNPSTQPALVRLNVQGAQLKGTGTRWQIADPDPMAFNDPDQEPTVKIEQTEFDGRGNPIELAPCSVTLFALDAD
jgi:alpha-L-arabinofuranosidase